MSERSSSPRATRPATRRMVSARARGIRNPSGGSAATCSAVGKRCVIAPLGRSRAVPVAVTSLPSDVLAPATETCWPKIARTTSSKPSNVPGTRRPGDRAIKGAILGSRARAASIVAGSASRSNARRTCSRSPSRSGDPPAEMRTSTWSRRGVIATTPPVFSSRTDRTYPPARTSSMPDTARTLRNDRSVSAAKGARYGSWRDRVWRSSSTSAGIADGLSVPTASVARLPLLDRRRRWTRWRG